MTQALKLINARIYNSTLVELAVNSPEARFSVRVPSGVVSFFVVGDFLEAHVTPQQGEYLSPTCSREAPWGEKGAPPLGGFAFHIVSC